MAVPGAFLVSTILAITAIHQQGAGAQQILHCDAPDYGAIVPDYLRISCVK